MKTIYLVRHGESISNVGPVRATDDAPLTENGRSQASRLAERCIQFPIEVIFSGKSKRAGDTAHMISEKIGVPFVTHEYFSERRKPSVQVGKPKHDADVIRIDREIRDNFHVPGYRHSDEENFEDLKDRMSQALDLILSLNEENVLIVTHGIVMRLLIARAIMGSELTGSECERFYRGFRMHNTGICILKHTDFLDEEGRASPWQLWTWNDSAHLMLP